MLKCETLRNIDTEGKCFVGEVSLTGDVRKVNGVLSMTLCARENGLSVEQVKVSELITPLLDKINIGIEYVDGTQHVILNGEDLGDKIRQPDISMYASAVSSVPNVRAFLLDAQKELARKNSVIMDGRDIGTVILPDADVKIFLTASNEARAMRRYNELVAKGQSVKYEDVLGEMNERDHADSTRSAAPLKAADDAIYFDNSDYDFDGSVEYILKLIEDRTGVKKNEE
jgi:cytidylate kinase